MAFNVGEIMNIKTLYLIMILTFIFFSCKRDMTSPNDVPGTVTDIDGNVYNTVKIGDQVWMAENLKVTHYRNGDSISNVLEDSVWENLTSGAYCIYDNADSNFATYGLLYNWYSVDDNRGLAPEGWHIPTDEEWKKLEIHLGMSRITADSLNSRGTDEGGKLKEIGTMHWNSPNSSATNEYGFSALPGGLRHASGDFVNIGFTAKFWTSTEFQVPTVDGAYARVIRYDESIIFYNAWLSNLGFSIRCVKD